MIKLVLTFFVAFLTVATTTKPLILIALKKRLFDAPTEARKIHKKVVPNLGGLSVFSGFLFTVSLFVDNRDTAGMSAILAAGVIIFVIGLKDDIIGMDPMKKFLAQFTAAFIITLVGGLRIEHLGGLMGIESLSAPLSIFLSVFLIVGLINAYNLIDGINGLVGCMGCFAALSYGALFYMAGDIVWATVAFALAGALVGFLFYNITPARIFMGDCGSLVIGLVVAVFSIHFINMGTSQPLNLAGISIDSAPGLAAAIAIVPVFDTLRVFIVRMARGKSPFFADRNHLHHRLLDLGLSHTRATLTLTATAALFTVVAFYLQPIGSGQLLILLGMGVWIVNVLSWLYAMRNKHQDERREIEQALLLDADPEVELNTQASGRSPDKLIFADEALRRIPTRFDPNNN